ncbi:TetR family transcriptional regulator [Nonomuraea phyllanthi]|uniref:TetR family transcriptional regulator n=1 Tax=Nonomuraea phyllanthi TaxID=2219224 RepID=A0A5C4WID0_9ACTN|nr:TetR/AcrR family transcriptional regulator [Nonomuraea phyllanthi]KAB8194038.1 TetR family transcriptional regulator [Nonomuraea phyllanthi]
MATTKDSNTSSGDRRVRRTHATLARALLELVEERELSRISVSDVAERAGVSRSAFYDHYRDVHELAEAACTAMIDRLIRSLPSPGPGTADPTDEVTQSLAEFFAALAEHGGLYRSLLGPQGSPRVADHIRRRVSVAVRERVRQAAGEPPQAGAEGGADREDDLDVPAAFTAGALIGVATEWLTRGCPRSPAEMAALTWPLFSALHAAVMR